MNQSIQIFIWIATLVHNGLQASTDLIIVISIFNYRYKHFYGLIT